MKAWIGDWEARIYERVQSIGCASVRELLASFPAEGYVAVARRLGEDVVGAQLQKLQVAEALRADDLREAACDWLSRALAHGLETGWGEESDQAVFRRASAYASWSGGLTTHASDAYASRCQQVWTALKALQPPADWRPQGAQDPLLRAAFDAGWSQPAP